jgi:RNA polymerase sigma-70 factor (sigma-E family)
MMQTSAAAIGRERADIENLYRAEAQRFGRVAFLLTGNTEQAQDLVQEAFARMFHRWRSIKDPSALESYLRRTIVNLAQKAWRKRVHEQNYIQSHRSRDEDFVVAHPDLETKEQLFESLRRLPSRQQAAIVLRYYEDLPEREIAKVLDCPVGTVKSSLARGLRAMKIQLEGDLHE